MEIQLPAGVERLPRHRAKIEASCRAGMAIPQLTGMVISGSFALAIADEYSDVDLKLIADDDGFDAVVRAQEEIIAACGTPIARFPADHTGLPELTIVLYDDLVHVDILPIRLSELGEKNAGMPAQVLWERDGSVSRELSKPQHANAPLDLQWFEQRIWTWFWYLQSKVLRGEVYEVLDGLAWLRANVLFPLLGSARGEVVSGARRVEHLLEDLSDVFARTAAGVDRGEAMESLRACAELYKRLADPALKERGVDLATDARASVGAALEQGLDWSPP